MKDNPLQRKINNPKDMQQIQQLGEDFVKNMCNKSFDYMVN